MAKTSVKVVPEIPGELTKSEAQAFRTDPQHNLASNRDTAERVGQLVSTINREHTNMMRPLYDRWRLTEMSLAGNTLENGGPMDAHTCEVYKAREILVPRLEDRLMNAWPWFRVEPRKEQWRAEVRAIEAISDFYFDQSDARFLVAPNAHDYLVAQAGIYHVQWENEFRERISVSSKTEFGKDGSSKKRITSNREERIYFSGPRPRLVDPFDFLIHFRASNAQDAAYVGHRCVMRIDEVRRIGEEQGWTNLGRDLKESNQSGAFGNEVEAYKWGLDPTYAGRDGAFSVLKKRTALEPDEVELTFLYMKLDPYGDRSTYRDYRIVMANGSLVLDIRRNPHDGDMRPYALSHVHKNGRSFYSTGRLDMAIRMEMHADRLFQDAMHTSALAGRPLVFTEQTGRQIPKSLLHVEPFSVIQGVGRVQMTEFPTGGLQSQAAVLSLVQRQLESVVGVSQLQYGQDLTGGTATESTIALQEANRRIAADLVACARGLSELMQINYRLAQQYGIEDIEVPVLGKRRVHLGRDFINVTPQELMADVKFRMVGLENAATHGAKASGYAALMSQFGPLILQSMGRVKTMRLLHQAATELVGRDDADQFLSVPDDPEDLLPQSVENELLHKGPVEVSADDDHREHLRDRVFRAMVAAAKAPDSRYPAHVAKWIMQHELDHKMGEQRQMREEEKAQMAMQQLPPEAGGTPSPDGSRRSPLAGGYSDALVGGQTPGEVPGPTDMSRMGRAGRKPTAPFQSGEVT